MVEHINQRLCARGEKKTRTKKSVKIFGKTLPKREQIDCWDCLEVLQCVVVCCSELQNVAVCCSVLQGVVVCC